MDSVERKSVNLGVYYQNIITKFGTGSEYSNELRDLTMTVHSFDTENLYFLGTG